MASHDDHYSHGEMEITEQSAMYQSFLVATQWGCVLIAAMVACMALIWGADVPWLQAVLGCGALSVVAGLGMKMGSAFTITSVLITIIGLISGGISTVVGMFI
ncbi:Cytochrome c oxidase, subunit IV, bacterial aa3 type [Caulobacteraceae bacterium]